MYSTGNSIRNAHKGKVFFHPIEGYGALTISWTNGPKGDAVEAKKGSGVGFFLIKGTFFALYSTKCEALKMNKRLNSIDTA